MSEKGTSNWRAVHRVDAFQWEGGAFRKVWGFDFGKESGAISGEGSGRIVWALAAPTPDGMIRADLVAAARGSCGGGAMSFVWSGGGFKSQKGDARGGCVGSWWPGGESSVLGMGEVNLERLAKKAAKGAVGNAVEAQ